MSPVKTSVSLITLFAGALLTASACQAQDAPRACGSVTSFQKRIVERADEGIEALRSFVWISRVVHGSAMVEVQAGLDAWRATVICQQEVAAAAAAAALAKAQAADAPAAQVAAVAR